MWKGAKGLAIVIVSLWNFLANKYWTFRHKRPSQVRADAA